MAHQILVRYSQNYLWVTSDLLGHGATAQVYKARHKTTGKQVAVKIFNPVSHQRPQGVQMREFEILGQLNHRNIIMLLCTEEELPSRNKVIVMELCTGGSLWNFLDTPKNSFGLTETEFILMMDHVASGMGHLRREGIVHRDIKPGNIMRTVQEDGSSLYKLTDFGAARQLDEEESFTSMYGTEEYLHPDLYQRAVLRIPAGKTFTASVDLWSVGVTFYHAATGALPFQPFGGRRDKNTMYQMISQKKNGDVAGSQQSEGGTITWYRDLPHACCLSRGLGKDLVPLLGGLMEVDASLMCTFDFFLAAVNNIAKKKVLYVFSMISIEILHIYVEEKNTLRQIQVLIDEQTKIKPQNQFLMVNQYELCDVISSSDVIKDFPHNSLEEPIFLFFKDIGDFPPIAVPTIPHYPPFNPNVVVDEDYIKSKQCVNISHLIKKNIIKFSTTTRLVHRGITDYVLNMSRIMINLRASADQFKKLLHESDQRATGFFTAVKLQENMLTCIAAVYGESDVHIREMKQAFRNAHIEQNAAIQEIEQVLRPIASYAEDSYNKVVLQKKCTPQWRCLVECRENKCISKLANNCSDLIKIMEDFKKSKIKRTLNPHEEQIQKFEKVRFREICMKCDSLITEHCWRQVQKLYDSLKDWSKKVGKTRDKLLRLNTRLSALTTRHTEFADFLNEKSNAYYHHVEMHLMQLSTNAASRSFPTASQSTRHVEGRQTNSEPRVSTSHPGAPPMSLDSNAAAIHQSLLRDIHQGLKALQSESANVRGSLGENNEMLKHMEDLYTGLEGENMVLEASLNMPT